MSSPATGGGAAPVDAAVSTLATRALPAAVAAGAAVAVAHGLNAALDRPFADLDAEREGNFLTWLSVGATFAAAAAAAVHALLLRRHRAAMGVLAAALAFLSLDDAIEIHERLGDRVSAELPDRLDSFASALQLLLVGPALALAFAGVLLLARRTVPAARRTLLAGLAFLAAAIAIELLLGVATNELEESGVDWPDVVRHGLEEGVELSGWIAVASGATAATCAALVSEARR
jgi:hypothetical protein